MEYSDLIPTTVPKKGIYLYDYCPNCDSERPHFVIMRNVNTIRKTVVFDIICWKCVDDAIDFNEVNHQINLGSDHLVLWSREIYSIHHWNEWVATSKIKDEDLPPYPIKHPDDEKKT